MGIPNGKDDVIWYDFMNMPGFGGFPGLPGANAVFSGHVDYHPHYEAVFWDLHLLGQGDEIDVQLLDGSYVRYAVDWTQWMGENDAFTPFAMKDGWEHLTIVGRASARSNPIHTPTPTGSSSGRPASGKRQ